MRGGQPATGDERAAPTLADEVRVQEILGVGLWEWNLDPEAFRWSPVLFELLGVDPETLENPGLAAFLDAVHPDDRTRVRQHVEAARDTGAYEPFEFRATRGDEVAWFASRGEVAVEDGRAVRVTATVREITEDKRRTEALEEARREAEKADQAKSMFLANVSHEIRTPMTAILGLSNLLLERELEPTVREDIETVFHSGKHLLALLDDVLDLSKVAAGELDVVDEAYDLRTCVESVLEMLAHEAGGKDIDLVYWMGEDVPEAVVGDADRLRQVLVNLVSNAIKFTETGGVTVTIERPTEGDPELAFAVEDTGIGIAEEDQAALFEPFEQVDDGPTSTYQGTGLGLAISKRLVELMGGTIELDSTLGEGTTFTVRLPLPAADESPERPWQAAPETFRGTRVLVVDDSSTNRDILHRQLAVWEMAATTTGSPEEALSLLGDRAFGLVISDRRMPAMNGDELARRIGDQVPDPPPVLLLSSAPSDPDAEMPPHVRDLLHKPVLPSELFDAIGRALGAAVQRPEAETPLDGATATRKPLDILVADDSSTNRTVHERMLNRLGYDPETAVDGREVVERFDQGQRFDVVLMDVQMPELDGFASTRRIRERVPPDQQPRIVALTAHASSEDRERCLTAGMDGYLAKPVEMDALVQQLDAVG